MEYDAEGKVVRGELNVERGKRLLDADSNVVKQDVIRGVFFRYGAEEDTGAQSLAQAAMVDAMSTEMLSAIGQPDRSDAVLDAQQKDETQKMLLTIASSREQTRETPRN